MAYYMHTTRLKSYLKCLMDLVTCTVAVFSKKFLSSGFRINISSGIHESPIFGKVLKARPWKFFIKIWLYTDVQSQNWAVKGSVKKKCSYTYRIVASNKCSWDGSDPNKNAYRECKTLDSCCPFNPSYRFSRGFRHNDRKSSPQEPRVNDKCWGQMSSKSVRTYSWFNILWCRLLEKEIKQFYQDEREG